MTRLEELKLEHEKRLRQLKNADPVQVGFLNKAITRIEQEMAELETTKEPELKEIDIIVDGKKLKFNKAGVANIPHKSLLKRVDLSHYIIMYGSDTGKDAELVYKDGKWNISCCDLQSSPEFVYEELGMAVTYMIEFMHDKYTHPETIDTTKLLKDFDLDDLDILERQHYDHHIKYMPKEQALQVIINTVESDFSQLSPSLAEIAEIQEKQGTYVEGAVTLTTQEEEQVIPVPKKVSVKKKAKKVDIEDEDKDELKRYLTILQELKEKTKSKVAARQIESEIAEIQEMIDKLS
ncbi:MAG: hypothetical protein PHW73_00230 [Atribacterota bacterium]|nr:hypothetical protein [Atribacterota bacterium]